MLRGYFDESGHEGKEWVSVAGFIGNREQWLSFVPRWRNALGQRPHLHMTELRWAHDRSRRLLARLGPIPHACGLTGARGVVRVADYADLVADTDDQRSYSGYIACLMMLVQMTLRGLPKDEQIEFVFEEQRQYQEAIDLTMSFFQRRDQLEAHYVTSTGAPKLVRWCFVRKGAVPMLDPADYLAFALRELHAAPGGKKDQWCGPIFQGGFDGYGRTLDRDLVRRVVMGAQRLNREQGLYTAEQAALLRIDPAPLA